MKARREGLSELLFRLLRLSLALPLALAWPEIASAGPEDMPDVGQPYGWWYAKAPAGGFGGGGGRPGGGGADGEGRQGGGGPGGGGGRPGGGGPGGRGGGGRPVPGTPSLYLGLSGATAPTTAPEVFYRLTPRSQEGESSPLILQIAPVLEDGTWRINFAAPAAGLAEVFSRFELAGRTFYAQTNCMVNGPVEGSVIPADRPAEAPTDWPTVIFPNEENGQPFRTMIIGQTVKFALSPSPTAGTPSALALGEAGYGPPDPVAYDNGSGQFTYTAEDEATQEGAESRGGRQVVLLVTLPGDGGKASFSLTVNRPRVGRGGYNSKGLALVVGAGTLTAGLIGLFRL